MLSTSALTKLSSSRRAIAWRVWYDGLFMLPSCEASTKKRPRSTAVHETSQVVKTTLHCHGALCGCHDCSALPLTLAAEPDLMMSALDATPPASAAEEAVSMDAR